MKQGLFTSYTVKFSTMFKIKSIYTLTFWPHSFFSRGEGIIHQPAPLTLPYLLQFSADASIFNKNTVLLNFFSVIG